MKTSAISWCDYSGGAANFVLRGSTPGDCECSPGCAHCYMLALHKRFGCLPERTTCYPEKLERLSKMRFPEHSPKRGPGHRPTVFVVDGGDLFHEDVWDDFILAVATMMARREDVTWQVLTKRAQRMHDFSHRCHREGLTYPGLLPNVWLGVSVEDQKTANERIPLLLDTPAAVRFVSVEPMLGPVDMRKVVMQDGDHLGPTMNNWGCDARLDWIICGAESGPNRRPFDVRWAADLYQQCKDAGVAYFGKQDSALKPGAPLLIDGEVRQEWPKG